MIDDRKPVDYGPSSYSFDFDFDFKLRFTLWDYCLLTFYTVFCLPLLLAWQVALSPAITRVRKFSRQKNKTAGAEGQCPRGATCPWPREAVL